MAPVRVLLQWSEERWRRRSWAKRQWRSRRPPGSRAPRQKISFGRTCPTESRTRRRRTWRQSWTPSATLPAKRSDRRPGPTGNEMIETQTNKIIDVRHLPASEWQQFCHVISIYYCDNLVFMKFVRLVQLKYEVLNTAVQWSLALCLTLSSPVMPNGRLHFKAFRAILV